MTSIKADPQPLQLNGNWSAGVLPKPQIGAEYMPTERSRSSRRDGFIVVVSLLAAGLIVFSGSSAFAHCDGLDGPVVAAARVALQTGNINHVLIWVRPADAAEIKAAFDEALAVRKLSPQAENLADRSFFETLVRVHRAAEGAPFTGLKAAGRDLGPAIPAADDAIKAGKGDNLERLLINELQEGVATRFKYLEEKKNFAVDDVTAGRDYVQAYVDFIHYVERLHEAAATSSNGHYKESE